MSSFLKEFELFSQRLNISFSLVLKRRASHVQPGYSNDRCRRDRQGERKREGENNVLTVSLLLRTEKVTRVFTMSKFAILVAALAAASCSAFTASPQSSVQGKTALREFCNGYVGGEGPEPMPFVGVTSTSVEFDPAGFTTVRVVCVFIRVFERICCWLRWFCCRALCDLLSMDLFARPDGRTVRLSIC